MTAWEALADWGSLDTWIVVTAALAAVACALPGTFLVLRRQSLMGDALSHATLPGIVLGFLAFHVLKEQGWVAPAWSGWVQHGLVFVGATLTGLLCGLLTEVVIRAGKVEPSAALGVVFTSLFAFGLLLIRLAADSAHIDPGCVLYGNLETIVTDTVPVFGLSLPRAVLLNGAVLLLNLALLMVFYKELQLTTFDAALATALGIRATWIQVALLACAGMTVVAAFESVGSILVIAMLVAPPATALLLSDRLSGVLGWSCVLGALSAIGGHVAALIGPPLLRAALGWPELGDVSTAGMIAAVSGGLCIVAWIAAPRHGLLRQVWNRAHLRLRIVAEDLLGLLFRIEEPTHPATGLSSIAQLATAIQVPNWQVRWAVSHLKKRGAVTMSDHGPALTDRGRTLAQQLVRSHRLWEAYLATNFQMSNPQMHASAAKMEHYLNPQLREELAAELAQPAVDPHGATIPPEEAATR
ncbi:MAG TPA: metal ABC transporter permease [Planctomycetaceae bacterium]|nr:metal ABC transporter permease [Planctomycetaceae bacterium]